MSMVGQLEQTLYKLTTNPPSEDLRIKGWRFAVNQYETVKVGIRDNKLGEVYAAPSSMQSCNGDLLIIWPGNLCSHAAVNAAVVDKLYSLLPLWKKAAFHDPEGSVLLKPAAIPLVAVEDRRVKKTVIENPDSLFGLLDRYTQETPNWQIDSLQAGASAGWGIRHIRTSQGLSVSYAQTSFNTYLSADGLFSKHFAKRRIPTGEEVAGLIHTLGSTVQALKRGGNLASSRMQVIFAPGLVGEFSAKYLLANFSGNSVVNSQGAFSLEDFRNGRQTFDSRINILLDPLKPLELSSYLCTREGLPAAKSVLAKNGRLVSPFLTVKDSIKAGLEPTALPQGSGLFVEVSQAKDYQELIGSVESGILVHSVMGLHTQDSSSGRYSLSAPNCLKIEKGKPMGRVKAVITGNFLEHLSDPETEYGKAAGENFPAMLFKGTVVAG